MSFANAAMLLGLVGVAIPVFIHLLARRRATTIDWGAMQFLQLGRRARTRVRLAEWLLMAARMLLLAVVALAAARPIWSMGTGVGSGGVGPRDIVLVVDASAGMGRRGGGTSPIDLSNRWISAFLDRLGPGDAVAVVRAGGRSRAVLDPPGVDRDRIRGALDGMAPPSGTGDLPSAMGEAFRILGRSGRNPSSEVVVLTDGNRDAWRPDDRGRWRLLRDLHGRLPVPPRITVETFPVEADPDAADGAVLDVRPSRRLAAPGATIRVGATIRNAGPSPMGRSAELVIDGVPVPGSSRGVGPVPPGGSVPVEFRASLAGLGSHAITVRLVPGGTPDPLPADDGASAVVEVAEALPVLLVDGEPGLEPMTGEVDFLRAALAPRGDEAPQVRASVIGPEGLDAAALEGQRVLVLANVDRLSPGQSGAVAAFLDRGGGVLVAPGDRTDAGAWNADAFRDGLGWLPARIGPPRGRFEDRSPAARPSPSSFAGPVLGPLARGGASPLGSAALFDFFTLEPVETGTPAAVLGRLDSGDPWLIERASGDGLAAILAGPLDAEGGTLPANPDFVPLVHELISHLADPGPDADASSLPPGGPLVVPLDPATAEGLATIPVRTPSGRIIPASIGRDGDAVVARLDEADEPGIYRFELPDQAIYRLVPGDSRAPSRAPLSPDEADALTDGWPLTFASAPDAPPSPDAPGRSPRPLWRVLLLAALAGLCLEVWLTRRLALARGVLAA